MNSKAATRTLGVVLGSALSMPIIGCVQTGIPRADLILTHATIYTADSKQPQAEALAIKNGRFLYVGSNEGVERFAGQGTIRSDLKGRLALPGLIDGHTHPGYVGVEQFGERLPATSHEDLIAAVKTRSESKPGEQWLHLCCWAPASYVNGRKGPHKSELDAVVSDRPVWIQSRSFHSYWLNSRALETIGVNESTPDPAPGVALYDRDSDGQITGWVKEGAGWQHFATQFKTNLSQHQQGIRDALRFLSEHGVTTVYDGGNFGYEDEVYSYLARLDQAGELPLRYEGTYQVFTRDRRNQAVGEMRRMQAAYGSDRLRFRTVKLFMDGIAANRTAALLEPYADIPDFEGQTLLSAEELRDFLLELHEEKLDLHIHVIGDLATRRALDAIEAAQSAVEGDFYPRVTLAHLNLINPADLPRFAELGVSANYTAHWHRMNRGNDPALHDEQEVRLFSTTALLDAGANVTFSSDDWRLEVYSPFVGMQIGHLRRPIQGPGQVAPEPVHLGPGNPSLEQMLKGYTINGAYPFRMENEIGSIEAGKIADLIVLDENLFEADKNTIHQLKPSVVIMEGRIQHGALPD